MIVPLILSLALVGALDDDADFQSGIRAYRELSFEQALVSFGKSANQPHVTGDQATINLWTGLCHAGLGANDQARVFLRKAVALDANVDVPDFTPPLVRRIIDEERAAITGKPPPPPLKTAKPPPPPPPKKVEPPPPPPKKVEPPPPPPPKAEPKAEPPPVEVTPPAPADAGDAPPPPGQPDQYEEMPSRGPLTPPNPQSNDLRPSFGWGVLSSVVGVAAAGGAAVFLLDVARVESEIIAIDDELVNMGSDDPARGPLLTRREAFQSAGVGDIAGGLLFGTIAVASLGVGTWLMIDGLNQ